MIRSLARLFARVRAAPAREPLPLPPPPGDGLRWYELPASLIGEHGVIRVLETADTNVEDLRQSFVEDRYPRAFLLDDGDLRRLHFDRQLAQSAMAMRDPDRLVLAYSRAMMAFLLFCSAPAHVLIIGLGGGSLTRFCHRQLPQSRVTTVELDAHVIELSRGFGLPPADERLHIRQQDGIQYLETMPEPADVIMVDVCSRHGIASAFCEAAFYRLLRCRLSPHGIAVVNLIVADDRGVPIQKIFSEVFDGQDMWLRIDAGNRLLFGFKDPTFAADRQALRKTARRLQNSTGIEFKHLLGQLLRNARNRRRR